MNTDSNEAKPSSKKKEDLAVPVSADEMAREAARLQLETAKMQHDYQKMLMEKAKDEADEHHLKKQAKEINRRSRGESLRSIQANQERDRSRCSHLKGGNAGDGALRTGGNSPHYAVIKHQMINADIWVRCLRCGKTWKPPIEDDFYFDERGISVAPQDGKFDRAKFDQAWSEYKTATAFPTNNTMSTSVLCSFQRYDTRTGRLVDAKEEYRRAVRATDLT